MSTLVRRNGEDRVVRRGRDEWRAATLSYLGGRSWILPLAVMGVTMALLLIRPGDGLTSVVQGFWLAAFALPLALTRRLVSSDRSMSAWALLFQRRGRPSAHFLRKAMIALTILIGMLACTWVIALAVSASGALPVQRTAGLIQGSLYVALAVFCVGFGVGAAARRSDTELVLLLLFASFLQGVISKWMALGPSGAVALELLLFPVNGLNALWTGLARGAVQIEGWRLLHILLYSCGWLTAGLVSLRRLDYIDIDVIGRE